MNDEYQTDWFIWSQCRNIDAEWAAMNQDVDWEDSHRGE